MDSRYLVYFPHSVIRWNGLQLHCNTTLLMGDMARQCLKCILDIKQASPLRPHEPKFAKINDYIVRECT